LLARAQHSFLDAPGPGRRYRHGPLQLPASPHPRAPRGSVTAVDVRVFHGTALVASHARSFEYTRLSSTRRTTPGCGRRAEEYRQVTGERLEQLGSLANYDRDRWSAA